MRTVEFLLCVAIAIAAIGCERRTETTAPDAQPPVSMPGEVSARVTAIEIGSAIGEDKRVEAGAGKATFSPNETIYVSILTEKAPGATLSARWTFEDGQFVSEGRETLNSADRNATEFHITKPDGFPAGRYRVEIALDDKPVGTREFEVR